VCLLILNQPLFSQATNIHSVIQQKWGYYESWFKLADIREYCTPSVSAVLSATVPAAPAVASLDQFNAFLPPTPAPPTLPTPPMLPTSWSPLAWTPTFPLCNSFSQSPINIRYKFSKYKRSYKKIVVTTSRNTANNAPNSAVEAWNIDNIDHTLVLTPAIDNIATAPAAADYKPRYDYQINLKPDGETFKLKRIVFRWPTSEHLYNSKRYDMEAQLEFELGAQKAVIAYFFKLSDTDNPDLAIITDNLANVMSEGPRTPAQLASGPAILFRFSQLFPTTLKKYFRYTGTLTYPPCDQNVKWIVARSPVLKVSLKQIQLFQNLKFRYLDFFDGSNPPILLSPEKYWCQFNILTNVRPVQRRNDRKVYRSFKNKPRKREGEGEGEGKH